METASPTGSDISLPERIRDVNEMFCWRNAMYLRGDKGALFIFNAYGTFMKEVRKNQKDPILMAKALASIFARTAAYAGSFCDLPIVEALSCKYPEYGCAYCGQIECVCSVVRTAEQQFKYQQPSGVQRTWTISRWCSHNLQVYGKANIEKGGLEYATRRLLEEAVEVQNEPLLHSNDGRMPLVQLRNHMADEFADVFAWIIAITAMLGVEMELESVLETRHGNVHKGCGKRPCTCGPFHWYPEHHIAHAESKVAR